MSSQVMIGNTIAKKYGPHMVEKAREYIAYFLQEQPDDKKLSNMKEVVPSIAGLALYLGISRETVNQWRKSKDAEHAPFAECVSDLYAVQEVLLLSGGLGGAMKERLAMFILNTHHDYVARTKTDHVSSDGSMKQSPTQIQIIAPGHDVDPKV